MNKIEIKGYKSFKEVTLDLHPLNILIGANGAGKSNFLSLFEMLGAIYDRRQIEYVARRGGVDKFLHHGKKETESIQIRVVADRNSYDVKLQEADGKFIISSENTGYLFYNTTWDNREIAHYTLEANIKLSKSLKRNQYIRDYLSQIRKFHFHDTGSKSPFSSESHIVNDAYILYEQGQNIAAFLFKIQSENPAVYARILKVIQSVAPYFNDFYFNPSKAGTLRLQWRDKYSSMIYGPNDLSDGTIRFVALTTLFLQPTLPQVIIIDEPELGLHPVAIQKLAGMIRSAANRGTQIIVATQSVDLISNFEPDDIVVVDQIDGKTLLNRLEEDELKHWLDDYSLGDLWKQNILKGGQPR